MRKRKLVFLFLIVLFLGSSHAFARADEYDLIIIVRGLGSIDHPIGLTSYEEDTTITITATPEENWKLQHWQKNGQIVGTSDSIRLKMSVDIELIVTFEEIIPNCMITFNVLNEDEKPVELVNIVPLTVPEFQSNITLSTGTDGSVQSDSLYHGDYLFKIHKQGYVTTRSEISLLKGDVIVHDTQLLWKKVDVSITLIGFNENPVKNIKLKSIQQPEHQQTIYGFTNEEGVAVFKEVLPGNYLFEILDEYLETEHIEINTTLDNLNYSISEEVQVLCNLQGRVEDDKGNPLENVSICIVQQSDGNEVLNFTGNGEYMISGIYPGSYSILFRKDGYQNVSISINLATYGLHPLRTVALTPIPPNFTPYYIVGVLTCSLILVSYIGYKRKIRIIDKPDYFPPHWQDIEKESEAKVVQLNKLLYFGTDKGAIIKTICIDDYHTPSDILEHSGLIESKFWDAFYELVSDGELESTQNNLYIVRKDIQKEWLASQ